MIFPLPEYMKRLLFLLAALAVWTLAADAQSIYDQRELLYTNAPTASGVNRFYYSTNMPVGVGDAATGSAPPTTNQFRGAIVFGGVTVQGSTALVAGQSFAANAESINWPRSKNDNGSVQSILRAAVGRHF
jgi:hypothetical protein